MNIFTHTHTKKSRMFVALLMAWILILCPLQLQIACAESIVQKPSEPQKSSLTLAKTTPTKQIKRKLSFSANPSDDEISRARLFIDSLVPMDQNRSPQENKDLAAALLAFKNKKNREDVADLEKFLTAYPNSRWRAALELELGQLRFENGYLSLALKYWSSAWEASKDKSSYKQKNVADRAISNLVLLEARLGQTGNLEKHLSAISQRSLSGGVAEKVQWAREGLWKQKNHPEEAYRCGPYALVSLSFQGRKTDDLSCRQSFKKMKSTKQGTNLAQVAAWGRENGLKLQVAKRSPGAKIVVPALMHWSVGHFAAITAEAENRYHIADPTFDWQGSFWISKKALESETDGYFLVPDGPLPAGWRAVAKEEALRVWGKGAATSRDPAKTGYCPITGLPGPCPPGMPQAAAFSMNASLLIVDTPLSYSPPAGPDFDFEAKYTQGDASPTVADVSNLGPDWNLNWVSYLHVSGAGLTTVAIRVREGGVETYDKSCGPATYKPNLTSQCQIELLGDGSYKRLHPDGSCEIFEQLDEGSTNYFMTQVLDAQGNAASITYDADQRVTNITDAVGNNPTTLTYASTDDTNIGFWKVATITDGFGRSCQFGYDSNNQYLKSITDAVGNKSEFSYQPSSSYITLMTTPYGQTSFSRYTPQGSYVELPIGLRITFPDGSHSVIENWIDEQLQTYYWDREATLKHANDPANHNYSNCITTRFVKSDLGDDPEMPVKHWRRAPREAPVFFFYPAAACGSTGQHFVGSMNKPTQVARQVVGFRYTATIGGTLTTGDRIGIKAVDQAVPGGDTSGTGGISAFYTVKSTDTKSTVATNLAQAIMDDGLFQAFGLTASAVGETIILTSYSVNSTTYAFDFTTSSPTETITFAIGPRQAQPASITGTSIVQSKTVTVTVTDPALPGGHQDIDYLTQANDNPASVAQGLALGVNSNANLQTLGVSCWWSGLYTGATVSPKILLQSNSSNTSYSVSTQSGSGVSISLDSASTNGIVQSSVFSRNSLGKPTKVIDPVGRQFGLSYSSDSIDLLEVRETQGLSDSEFDRGRLIAHLDYNGRHQPTAFYDGAGQKTSLEYNNSPFYELTSTTDAHGNKTKLTYNDKAYLQKIDGPLTGEQDVTSFTFYGYGLPSSITDSQGYSVNFNYDNLNRPTKLTYLDGTTDETFYDRLDPIWSVDRLRRWSQFSFDNLDQLQCATDPLGRTTNYCWCHCGSLKSLTDAAGNTTKWKHDLQGRICKKIFASGESSSIEYAYDSCTGQLKSTTDALDQTTSFIHNLDSSNQYTGYSDSKTAPIQTVYDTIYGRKKSINNKSGSLGWGKYSYSYYPRIVNQAESVLGGVFLQGRPTTGDIVNVRFNNDRLAGGTYNLQYTVTSSDTTLPALATSLKNAINSDSTLATALLTATSNASTLTIKGVATLKIGGTTQVGDTVYVRVFDDAITGGSTEPFYTIVDSKATPATVASGLASQITGAVGSKGITASASNDVISILSTSGNPTSLSQRVTPGSATTTVTFAGSVSANSNGVATETLGGSIQIGDQVSITITDAGVSGGTPQVFSHTVVSGNTLADVAEALKTAINASLSGNGITAVRSGNAVVITSTSANATTYSQSVSNGATITVSFTGGPSETAAGGAAPIGSGRVKSVSNDVISNSTATYSFDGLGRAVNRAISTLNPVTWSFDGIDRLCSEINQLGTFNFNYISDSTGASKGDPRIASIAFPNGQSTSFGYLPNIADQRLQQISTLNGKSALISKFAHAYNAAGEMTQWLQFQSSNTSHLSLEYDLAGQLVSSVSDSGSKFKAYVSGTPHEGDVVSVTAYDASLTATSPVGQVTASYTVDSNDDLDAIATGLASQIDSTMTAINVDGAATGSIVSISTSPNNATQFSCQVTGAGATTTIALGSSTPILDSEGKLKKQNYFAYDRAGNMIGIEGDSKGSFGGGNFETTATQYKYNNLNQLTNISAGGPIRFQASFTNPVASVITNVSQTATIVGTASSANTMYFAVHDKSLSQAHIVSVSVAASAAPETIAGSLEYEIDHDSVLSGLGITASTSGPVVTISSSSSSKPTWFTASVDPPTGNETVSFGGSSYGLAVVSPSNLFYANPVLLASANTVKLTAVSGGGTAATNTYAITINGPSNAERIYDLNGNMTNAKSGLYPQFTWDANSSLTKIEYDNTGNNHSDFTIDPLGRCVKIVETIDGSVSSTGTKQFIWCGAERCEVRNASSSLNDGQQFFSLGQINFNSKGENTNRIYQLSHRDIVGATDTSGTEVAAISYSPYGQSNVLFGTAQDFGFASMYNHERNGQKLNLTWFRQYNATLGRWLSRDPLGESAGTNLYGYCGQDPINCFDPFGLSPRKRKMASNHAEYDAALQKGLSSGSLDDLEFALELGENNAAIAQEEVAAIRQIIDAAKSMNPGVRVLNNQQREVANSLIRVARNAKDSQTVENAVSKLSQKTPDFPSQLKQMTIDQCEKLANQHKSRDAVLKQLGQWAKDVLRALGKQGRTNDPSQKGDL